MAQITVQIGDQEPQIHELPEETVSIGRVEDNFLCLAEDSVSSHHAEINFDGKEYHLKDLDSTNGTSVNGNALKGDQITLHTGDLVRFGSVDCVFERPELQSDELDSRPLPEKSEVETESAHESCRPQGFACSSPIPRSTSDKDALNGVLVGVGVLAALAAVLAAVLALTTSVV